MADLTLTVRNRTLSLPQSVPPQITNTEYIDKVAFDCDSEYSGYTLVAVFKNGERGKPYPVEVPADRSAIAIDPRALRRKGFLYIGMFGVRGLNVLPTLWSPAIEIKEGTSTDEGEPDTESPRWVVLATRVAALETAVGELEEDVGELEGSVEALAEDVAAVEDEVEELQSGKQDTITDLDTIRSGAAAGATALQSVPIASADNIGGAKFQAPFGLGINTTTGAAYVNPATSENISNRNNNNRPITSTNMDLAFRTCITDPAQELTDEQKAEACATIGAERSRGEWEFIDEFNTADGMDINLQGRKEFIIVSTINATNTVHLTANNGALYIASSIGASGNTRRAFLQYADNDMFGIVPMVYRYADNNQSLFTNGSAYVRPFTDPFFTSDIYHIEFHNASYITSCNVRIYAR